MKKREIKCYHRSVKFLENMSNRYVLVASKMPLNFIHNLLDDVLHWFGCFTLYDWSSFFLKKTGYSGIFERAIKAAM